MKGGIILWLTCIMLISDMIFCDSSYIETRSITNKNVRCNSRKLERFGSLERIRLKSFRTLVLRKSQMENMFRSYGNETSRVIDFMMIDQSKLQPLRWKEIYYSQGNQNLEGIPYFRRGSRFIDEGKRQVTSKSRYGMVNTQLSNTDVITNVNSKEVMFLTMSRNRIDGRIKREIGNRFSIRLRENRFRDEFGLKRSISARRNYAERRAAMTGTGKRDASIQKRFRDNSESRKMSATSRRENTEPAMHENNRRNSVRQRNNCFKGDNLNNRRLSRNFRRSNLYESARERDSLNKLSNLRREQNSLISRRELKIPEGERIGVKNARRAQSVRGTSYRDQKNAENTLNRRNGKEFRGRMERRNIVEGRLENMIKVRILNMQVKGRNQVEQTESDQKEIAVESITRKSHMLLDSRKVKLTIRQHLRNVETDDFIPIGRNNKVLAITNDSDNRRYDTHRIRKTGQIMNRLRLSTPSRERRLTIRMESTVTERIPSNRERRRVQERPEIMRQALVSNLNQKDENSFGKVSRNRDFQGRRVLKANIRKSSMGIHQNSDSVAFVENMGQTWTVSTNDVLPFQSSLMFGDRHLRETRLEKRKNSVRDESYRSQIHITSRRLRVQSKVAIKLQTELFLNQIRITDSSKRETRNSNSRISAKSNDYLLDLSFKEHIYGRRIAVRRQRESHEYKEMPLENIGFGNIHNRRDGINLHRNRDLNRRRQIRNRIRIDTSRITKNIHQRKEPEQPKKQDNIEYSSMLRFKSKSVRHADHRNLEVKKGKVPTRISRMLVNPQQFKAFEINSSTEDSPGVNGFFTPDKNTKEVSNEIASLTNSNKLHETRQCKQYGFINYPISEPNNRATQTLLEFVTQKQNSMFSFVTNIILGLAVIVAMSDDTNKGLVSRLKNQLRNCIFRFATV